jgi:nucleoside-triphosphatase THEP1
MPTMKRVDLLTGRPRTGKTNLIQQAVAAFEGRVEGFYTEERCGVGIRDSVSN